MRTFFSFICACLVSVLTFAQTNDTSLPELKENYLKKRADFCSASTKKISTEDQAQLNAIVEQIKLNDEKSFEYNLIQYINGNYNTDLDQFLFNAYALNSADENIIKEMFGYYIITYNTAKQKEFLLKVQKYYTPAEIAYYTDALPIGKSLLFTSNQEDTYGFMLAQLTQGTGTEVQILNLDFMKNDSYREFVSNNTGINDQIFLGNEKNYLKNVLTSTTLKVYISSTVPQEYLAAVSDKIFLTGLSYQYGNIDQVNALNSFWSKVKTKDLSQLTLSKSAETKLYSNYLPPLLTLYMLQPGDQVLKTSIQAIALKVGREEEVNEILNEIETD